MNGGADKGPGVSTNVVDPAEGSCTNESGIGGVDVSSKFES